MAHGDRSWRVSRATRIGGIHIFVPVDDGIIRPLLGKGFVSEHD
jgi:hypothetical protein